MSDDAAVGGVTDSRRSRPWLKIGAVLLALLGLLTLGAGLGQLWWPATVVRQEVVVRAESSAEGGIEAVFPSVVGLDESTAMAAISDAGFSGAEVSVAASQAAGPEGFVVEQTPVAGSAGHEVTQIVLTVSRETVMPGVVGLDVEAAQAKIEALWGVVQLNKVTTADHPVGTVIATSPAEGEPMSVEVTLDVASGGDSLSLLEIDSVERSGCSTTSAVSVNGTSHDTAVVCEASQGRDRASFVEYAIGRHAVYFRTTVGMDDTGARAGGRVRVVGDGTVLTDQKITFGTASELEVEVRGVLRLRIEVWGTDAEEPDLVLGSPVLVGNPGDLDQIGG